MDSPDSDKTISVSNMRGCGLPSLASGAILGGYRIEKLLGAGTMGEVYLAQHEWLDRRCALKVLSEDLSNSRDFVQRFRVEGRALAKLSHEGIVRILNAGEDGGRHFLEMEYVDGGSLDGLLERSGGKLAATKARLLIEEVLSALSYAHEAGVIHRDLKPSNILLSAQGRAKIGDFGLALVAGEEFMGTLVRRSIALGMFGDRTLPDTTPNSGRRPSSGTDASALVGTFDFMSPEVLDGSGAADARSDIYAAGVIAYLLLTGRKPRGGRAKDPSKLVPGLDPAWDDWVFRCMEPEPSDRFQKVSEALSALPGNTAPKKVPTTLPQPTPRPIGLLEPKPLERPVSKPPQPATKPPAPKPIPPPTESKGPRFGEGITIKLPGNVPLEMVWIAPGTFTMGDGSDAYRVSLTKGYWLGKYQVTQEQWQALIGNNPSHFKQGRVVETHIFSADELDNTPKHNHPVENVSWDDSVAFCKNLTERERAEGRLPTGYEYSLPTEAQWEYACRAGTTGAYGGNGDLSRMGWYWENSGITTHPVGQKQANAWGLYDMHGNVWEWCADWYARYPNYAENDPTGPNSGSYRVRRGGSWNNYERFCRSADRYMDTPGYRNSYIGFRLSLRSIQ